MRVRHFSPLVVLGPAAPPRLMAELETADLIWTAYNGRAQAENWAAWANEHPRESEALMDAMMAARKRYG